MKPTVKELMEGQEGREGRTRNEVELNLPRSLLLRLLDRPLQCNFDRLFALSDCLPVPRTRSFLPVFSLLEPDLSLPSLPSRLPPPSFLPEQTTLETLPPQDPQLDMTLTEESSSPRIVEKKSSRSRRRPRSSTSSLPSPKGRRRRRERSARSESG